VAIFEARYLSPVAAVPVEPAGYRVTRAMLAGLVPLTLCGLIWLVFKFRQAKAEERQAALASQWLMDDAGEDSADESQALAGQDSHSL